MQGIAAHVADCIRVLGWRLDPHGVTASSTFSASSIEEWRAGIESWLARPSDNRVLIAVSILLDGRVIYGPDRLDVKPLLFETGDRETLERWMLRLALAAKPPTGFMQQHHRGGVWEARRDVRHQARRTAPDRRPGALRRARGRDRPRTTTLDRLRGGQREGCLWRRRRPGYSRRRSSCSAALRLEHQVDQLEQGREPDDHIDPRHLDPLTRGTCGTHFGRSTAVQRSLQLASSEPPGARHEPSRLAAERRLPRRRRCRPPAPRGGRSTFTVIDFETTGLDPATDEIISFATVTVIGRDGSSSHDARYELVRPEPDAGLRHDPHPRPSRGGPRRGAPRSTTCIDRLLHALTGRALVAHVASVERRLPRRRVSRLAALSCAIPVVDTAALDRELRRLRREPPSAAEATARSRSPRRTWPLARACRCTGPTTPTAMR